MSSPLKPPIAAGLDIGLGRSLPPPPPLPPPVQPSHARLLKLCALTLLSSVITSRRLAALRVQASAAEAATLPPAVSSAADVIKRAAKDGSVPPKQVFKALRMLEAAKLQPGDWDATIGGPPARRWRLVFVAGAKLVTAANKGKGEGGGFYFPLAGAAGGWAAWCGDGTNGKRPFKCSAGGAEPDGAPVASADRCGSCAGWGLGQACPDPHPGSPMLHPPAPPAAGCQRYDASTGDYQNGIVSAVGRTLCPDAF